MRALFGNLLGGLIRTHFFQRTATRNYNNYTATSCDIQIPLLCRRWCYSNNWILLHRNNRTVSFIKPSARCTEVLPKAQYLIGLAISGQNLTWSLIIILLVEHLHIPKLFEINDNIGTLLQIYNENHNKVEEYTYSNLCGVK